MAPTMTATTTSTSELKAMVTKTLEVQGVLGNLKAQLRAAVYKAIHHDTSPEENPLKRTLLATHSSQVALSIVVEFLRHFQLDQTLSVLTAETSISEAELTLSRADMAKSLNLGLLNSPAALLTEWVSKTMENKNSDDSPPVKSKLEQKTVNEPLPSIFSMKNDSKTVQTPKEELHIKAPINEEVKENAKKDEVKVDKEEEEEEVNESIDDEYSFSMESASPEKPQAPKSDPPPEPTPQSKLDTPQPTKEFEEEEDEEEEDDANVKAPPAPAQAPLDKEQDEDNDIAAKEDEAARLRALDAKLKAMEAEDTTGTLQQLKMSLQKEIDAKSDDGNDDGHYGSDFEEDFEEDIPSDVESHEDADEVESTPFKPSANDKPVANRSTLDAYDYVEDVIKP
ncbi:hypothetical protein LEN26_017650 [Aphanomyces euteiches]|nr:hypothetical protein LEN26_017650 [Aphanomyces euteiches]KAH9189458.1 hypothetical protein AeNC1_008564 [Aphanomyces euteiches]